MNLRPVPRTLAAMHSFRTAAAAALLLSASSAGPARASVVQGLDLTQKVDAAPVIVHGIVARVQPEWTLPGERIRTMVTLEVKTSLKGDVPIGHRLLVERGGGSLDGIRQMAPGLSAYEEGEEVILFLEPLGAHYVAIGIGIGKYEVRLENGERQVHHAPEVHAVRYTGGRTVLAPIPPMSPESFDGFIKRVRTLATRPVGTPAPKGRRPLQLRPPLPLPNAH